MNDERRRRSILSGSARGPRVRGDGAAANVRDPEPPHLNRTAARADRLYRQGDEAVAHHSGEHRGGEAIRH